METITFKLKKTLSNTCYNIDFLAGTSCGATYNFVFSAGYPCTNQMELPPASVPCNGGGTWTPGYVHSVTVPAGYTGNVIDWQQQNTNFTANLVGMNYMTVYVSPGAKYTLIDNIEISECSSDELTVIASVPNPNPCIGNQFQIDYTVINSGNSTIFGPVVLEADVSGTNGAFQIVANGDFNSSGQALVNMVGGWAVGASVQISLDVLVTNSATANQPYCVDFNLPPGICLNANQPISTCVIPGNPTLDIEKTITTPGPYAPGDVITYNINILNTTATTTNETVNDILIQDILPNGINFISASSGWQTVGGINVTQPFTLDPGDFLDFQITAEIDPGFGCGTIENCVSVLTANPFCGPVTDCVTLSTGAPGISAVVTLPSCFGGCDGSISLLPAGPNYYYTLMNPPGCYGAPFSTNNPVISPVSAGAYTIQLYDQNTGCTSSTQVVVDSPTPVTASATGYPTTCPGVCDGEIQVNAGGGYSPYSYSYGSGISSGNPITGLCGNLSYTITVSDALGCTATTNATVWDAPSVSATFSSTQASCATSCDASVTAILSGGTGALTWEYFEPGASSPTQNGSGSPAVMTGLCVGNNHLLQVTDESNCTHNFNFNTTGPALLSFTLLTTNETCLGDNDGSIIPNVSGGTPPYNYSWVGPGFNSSAASISGLAPGTYCLTVTDNNNCTASDMCGTVQPGLSISASVSVIDPISCNGACDGQVQVNPAGGGPSYIITVDPPNGNPYSPSGNTIQNMCAGTYSITVSDQNTGCSTTLNYNMANPPVLSVSSSTVTLPSCWGGGCDGQVTLAGAGGVPPYSYSFTSAGPWSATGYFNTLCQTTTYQLWVKDANGCTQSINVNVGTPIQPVYNTQVEDACGTSCNGSITTTASNGTSPYTFTLNGSSTQVQNSTASWTGLCPGNYTVATTDANGCTFGVSYTVSAVPADPWPKQPAAIDPFRAQAQDLAQVEVNGEYYLTGWFRGEIQFEDIYGTMITLSATGGNNDDDCFLAKYDDCGIVWAHSWGSTGRDRSYMVRYSTVKDKLYVGGEIRGGWNGFIDPGTGSSMLPANATNLNGALSLSTNLGQKGYVLQVDPDDGDPDWVWIAGDAAGQKSIVREVMVSQDGPVAGIDFQGSFDIGSDQLAGIGGWDIAVMVLDFQGDEQLYDAFGSTGHDGCRGLDTYIGGDLLFITQVAMTGFIGAPTGEWQGQPYNFYAGANDEDVFITIWDMDPNVGASPMVMEVFGGPGDDRGLDLVTTGNDATTTTGIFVTGTFNQILNITSNQPTSNGGRDAFVAGYYWNMTPAWAKGSGGSGNNDFGRSITIAPNNTVYAAGYAAGSSLPGFLSGMAATQSANANNYEEPWVVGFMQSNGLSTNVLPNSTDNGTGTHNRIYDLECTSNYLYTAGSFGGGVNTLYNFNSVLAFCDNNAFEPYLARMDYLGAYQPRLAVKEPESFGDDHDLVVFPNPTSGEFTVSWTSPHAQQLEVMDLNGRLVHQLNLVEGTQQLQLQMHEQAQGVYLVRLVTDSGVETLRLVKD